MKKIIIGILFIMITCGGLVIAGDKLLVAKSAMTPLEQCYDNCSRNYRYCIHSSGNSNRAACKRMMNNCMSRCN